MGMEQEEEEDEGQEVGLEVKPIGGGAGRARHVNGRMLGQKWVTARRRGRCQSRPVPPGASRCRPVPPGAAAPRRAPRCSGPSRRPMRPPAP